MSDGQEQAQQAPIQTEQQPAQSETPTRESGKISARNDVLAAYDEIEKGQTKEAEKKTEQKQEAKPGEKKKETGEPQRGPDGKFLPKADGAKADSAKDAGAVQEQPKPINAPATWKGSEKVDWNRLPRAVQEGIAAEFQRFTELEQRFNPLSQILAPREQMLVAQYGGVPQGISQLFALSDYAARDPQGFINWFAQSRGINLQQPVQQQQQPGQQFTGQQPQGASEQNIDPSLLPLVNELNGIKRFLNQQQQTAQQQYQAETQQVQQEARSEVQAFIANSAEYPYANDVRAEMSMLFQTGQAKTLKDAYAKAVYINDNVRERMIADRTKAELDKQAASAVEKKNAGVSVSGSPGGQAAKPGNRKATVRDDVIAAAQEIGYGGTARL